MAKWMKRQANRKYRGPAWGWSQIRRSFNGKISDSAMDERGEIEKGQQRLHPVPHRDEEKKCERDADRARSAIGGSVR